MTMCIKVVYNLSTDIFNRSSYCVSKVLLQYLKIPSKYYINRPVSFSVIKNLNTDSQEGIQTDVQKVTNDLSKSEVKKRKPKTMVAKDVLEYVKSNKTMNSLVDHFPQKFLKRKRSSSDPIYTMDAEVARTVAATIKNCINKRDVPTFEAHPGFGILSRELLTAGFTRLHLYDNSHVFTNHLKKLQDEFPQQIVMIKKDILSLRKLAFQDGLDAGDRVKKLLTGVSKAEWTDDPVLRLIGILPSLDFIRHLIRSHIFQTGIFAYGRPELYVLLSPSNYFLLTCGHDDGYLYYRSIGVLFQLIFNYKLLRKLPRKAFLPWDVKYTPKKWSKLKKLQSIDPECLYLIRAVPRQDFFENVKVEHLQSFWYFIWHHLVSRKNRVIPSLEKWIPHCGPRLIKKGMTIYTEFGELTPQEILSVFNDFVNWPEFSDSPFLSSMESTFMKMEVGSDEIGKEMEDDDDEDAVEDEVADANKDHVIEGNRET